MRTVAEIHIRPEQLGFRVLQTDPRSADPGLAARAVERLLARKRAGLARAIEVCAGPDGVILRAEGEVPHEMLREASELLGLGADTDFAGEIEVDPSEFSVVVASHEPPEPELDREVLSSRVRYFPYPEAEWFTISTGLLTLTDARVTYRPEWVIMGDQAGQEERATVVPLCEIEEVYRGEWWDIPCLMLKTRGTVYRYGWPAARTELEGLFEVDEWLDHLRSLREGRR